MSTSGRMDETNCDARNDGILLNNNKEWTTETQSMNDSQKQAEKRLIKK